MKETGVAAPVPFTFNEKDWSVGMSAVGPAKTTPAWAEAVVRQRSPRAAAEAEWTSKYRLPREDRQDEHVLVLGGVVPFEEVLRAEPRPDESVDGWSNQEESRLGRWACRLWDGLLAHEKLGSS